MEPYKIIEVKESIFADNDARAERLRGELKRQGTFLLNLMSSPGSGKTCTLRRTIEALRGELRMGVMEADIDSDVDAAAIAETGIRAIQLHTGGMCHLDADMTAQGLREFGAEDLDLVVLENVGNLVCPAEFDTGSVSTPCAATRSWRSSPSARRPGRAWTPGAAGCVVKSAPGKQSKGTDISPERNTTRSKYRRGDITPWRS